MADTVAESLATTPQRAAHESSLKLLTLVLLPRLAIARFDVGLLCLAVEDGESHWCLNINVCHKNGARILNYLANHWINELCF